MRRYIKIYEEFVDDELKNQVLDLIPDIIEIKDIKTSFSSFSDNTFSIYAEHKNIIINKISKIFKKDIYRMDKIMSEYYDVWYTLKETDGIMSTNNNRHNKFGRLINRRSSQLKGLIENLDKYESSVFVELIVRFKNKKEDELH